MDNKNLENDTQETGNKDRPESRISTEPPKFEVPSTLSSPEEQKRPNKSNVIKNQTKIIIVLAVLIVVAIPVYLFFLKPMIANTNSGTQDKIPELLEGEALTSSNGIAMMSTVESDDMKQIIIKNDESQWGFTYNEEDKKFYLSGYKNAPYDTSALSYICSLFGTAETVERKYDDCKDFSTYGLDDASTPMYYSIITKSGETHTVYVGNQLVTGQGYYARYEYTDANGKTTSRPALYVISTYIQTYVSSSMYDIMKAIITLPLDKENYVPSSFTVWHKGELFVNIKRLSDEEIAKTETAVTSHVFTSDNLEYNSGANYSTMLYKVLQPGIYGTKVVLSGSDETSITKEQLAQYGINTDNPDTYLHFSNKITGYSEEIQQDIIFSKLTDNNTYYAYSLLFDIIVEIKADTVNFVSWSLEDFVENSIYLMQLTNVSSILINSKVVSDKYVAAGIPRVFETFNITSSEKTDANGKETIDVDSVTIKSTGKPVSDTTDSEGKKYTGVDNFKALYATLLTVNIQFDIDESIRDKIDLDKPDIEIIVKTVGGKTDRLDFYLYDSRHAFYTLNGNGRFYVVFDEITRLLNNTNKLINGEYIDFLAKK